MGLQAEAPLGILLHVTDGQVRVPKTTGQLVIALYATHHQQLLEQLGGLGQGKPLPTTHPRRDGAVQVNGPPVLDQNGELCLSLDKRETGIAIGAVSIAYDPPPTPKTPTQIDALSSYCTGGGFTVHCPEFDAAEILKPPRPGYHYSSLNANEVVASRWIDSPSRFTMTAKMGSLLKKPGVYTVIAWRDDGGEWLSEQLVALSLFVD